MHIAPVVIVPHRLGPAGWTAALSTLAASLEAHPGVPLSVRLPGAAVERVSQDEPELWDLLSHQDILWLAGGFSDPILVMLPDEARAAQLRRERTALDGAGLSARAMWIADAWAPDLVSLTSEEGYELILADASLLPTLPDRPGAVERAGVTVTALAVADTVPEHDDSDDLCAVRVEPDELSRLVHLHRGLFISPDGYLVDHLPGERIVPETTMPGLPAEVEPFYRKVLLLTRDMGDRTPGQDLLFALQTRELLQVGHVDDEARRALIAARASLDRARHRGDGWVTVREVDWDADGVEELHVETSSASLIIDPVTCTLEVWDDKPAEWAVTAATTVLMRRLTENGDEPTPEPMRVGLRSEGRGEALVMLEDRRGSVCRLEIQGRALLVELTSAPGPSSRIGPEFPLAMRGARLRVDGGEWQETDEPLAATGHRFRLTDEEHTLVVEAARPSEMFTRPLPDGGLVIWPHWVTSDDSVYRLTLTPS